MIVEYFEKKRNQKKLEEYRRKKIIEKALLTERGWIEDQVLAMEEEYKYYIRRQPNLVKEMPAKIMELKSEIKRIDEMLKEGKF